MEKRLYRSRTDRMIWGVCGGLAKYFGIDPVIVRLIAVLLIFANGIGILAYIILAVVVPLESSPATEPRDVIRENVEEIKQTANKVGEDIRATFSQHSQTQPENDPVRTRNIFGLVLIIVGVVFLVTGFLSTFNIFWWFSWKYLWPIILVTLGLVVIFGTRRK